MPFHSRAAGKKNPEQSTRNTALLGLIASIPLLVVGCAGLQAVNTKLEEVDPDSGYRYANPSRRKDPGKTIVYLAFSGGGTRAAAFAYGVLEELRDTEIQVDGISVSLLDEVDTISGVSGGSFPAAYYGIYGDKIFEEFEPNFLKRNVQGALVLRTLLPWNLVMLATPMLNRSDLASSYYDKNIFSGATFKDLAAVRGPWIHINSTDLSSGERFTFSQDAFDVICSDLDALPISTAVAASSAVPMLLSPITLKNHAGECGYEPPEWVRNIIANRDSNPRRARTAENFLRFSDAKNKPYIHLIDGGISDNLGLRPAIDFVAAAGSAEEARRIRHVETPDRMIIILVNAETDPDPGIDLTSAAPSFASLMNSVSGGQIRRYNFETMLLAEGMLRQWGAELSTDDHTVTAHMVNVSFDNLEDESERRYFKRIPTSFKLSDRQVDRLREAGRRLLRESPDFQRLLEEMRE